MNDNTTPVLRKFGKVIEWRAVPVSDRALHVLADHALTLPKTNPVRLLVTSMLERYGDAPSYDFDASDETALTREDALAILGDGSAGAEVALRETFGITDAELDSWRGENDAQLVMEEAA